MPGIKTKSKTGSYAGGTKAQVQGKAQNKSQQDLKSMSDDYANSGAALRAVTPVGNQSYTDFQKNRKTPAGLKQKEDYETSNKLPRLTDADYQQRMFDSGVNKVKEKANSNPTQSVFTSQARDAAYGAQNKTSMEMGNQVSIDSGVAVTNASLADRSKRVGTSTAYSAPGMSAKMNTPQEETTPKKQTQVAMYKDGSKGIKVKSKGGMSNFINGESDKVKNMSDEDLKSAVKRNMNFKTTAQNAKEKELLDETVNRKYKKQGGYAQGTKGIKTKKMC